MEVQTQTADAAPSGLSALLRRKENVLGAWASRDGMGFNVHVLLRHWTRQERLRAYEARRDADPNALLYVCTTYVSATDDDDEMPPYGTAVVQPQDQ